jgi:Cdc6-like AAA superfamily ATPase
MGQTGNQGNDSYVPLPIFVIGPSGTGKTCIVRDVIDTFKRRYSSDCGDNTAKRIIGSAYVNCTTVEPSSLEAVLESAYSQLTASLKLPPRLRRVRKEKQKRNSTFCGRKGQKMRRHGVGFKLQSPVVEDANSNEVDHRTDRLKYIA